ncbi:MAG: hypothetical protein JEZ09_21485 [Salinivirgaceae bacterium]|nr:hypothetical protein [Salinivirgaceae bacterium]
MHSLITIQDALIVPLLLIVAYFVATRIKNKNIDEKPYYKYFRIGLFVKIFAGLAFAAIYLFYYGGGDTVYYFWGSGSIVKMLGKDIPTFLKLLGGNHSLEVFSMFDSTTGWPTYFRDSNSFAVCRFNVPFYMLGFGSFLGSTIVMNLFLYFGIWSFYKMLVELFPTNEKRLAYAVFFIPSVVFWSSGILKDGWTLVATLGIFTNFYHIFIVKKNIRKNLFRIIFWGFIAFSIRSFMLYASLGATLIWLGFSSIKNIKSRFLRVVALPFIMLITWAFGAMLFTQISSQAGNRYSSVDAMLETASIIQGDLKQDYYGGNSFDIGEFEPTMGGVIKKAPKAIVAGVFRPFIWEGEGVLMILSGLENFLILLLSLFVLLQNKIIGFLRKLVAEPILLAFFVLAISLAFSVGLTTANFGALVRYAIPVKLFFMLILFILFSNRMQVVENQN